MALALALKKLERKMNLRLLLVHVNYGLRGTDSDADEIFVKKFAAVQGLDLNVIKFKTRKMRGNREQIFRDFRYGEFEKTRKKYGYDWIAVAHNLDDQAETFFLNLIRGGGTRGLGAMKEKNGKIIRPLIRYPRSEILLFLRENGQKFRIDKSNKSPAYLRNRIRHNLIPYLKKNYLSSVKERIFIVCENLRDDYSFLEQAGLSAYNKVAREENNTISVDVQKILKLQRPETKLIFRKAVEKVKGDLKDIGAGNFFEFEKILKSEKSKRQLTRVGDVVIKKIGNEIIFSRKKKFNNIII